jgi:hypothetical protein
VKFVLSQEKTTGDDGHSFQNTNTNVKFTWLLLQVVFPHIYKEAMYKLWRSQKAEHSNRD